jgi:hypothetical protein
MKFLYTIHFLLICLLCPLLLYGGTDFRLTDPDDVGERYGKSSTDGLPYYYYGTTSQYYYKSGAYNNYGPAVTAAFSSWNAAGPVSYSESTTAQNRLQLTTTSSTQTFDGLIIVGETHVNPSGNIIANGAGASSIALSTHYSWGTTQDLVNDQFDVQSILVHEIGHAHGIAHPKTNTYTDGADAPTMAGSDCEYFRDSEAGRSLEQADIDATRFLQLQQPVGVLYTNIVEAIDHASDVGINTLTTNSNSFSIPASTTLEFAPNLVLTLNGNLTIGANSTLENADIVINSGVTVTIGSGVTFLMDEGDGITVNGTMAINGTSANPVSLTSILANPSDGDWAGISVGSNSTLNIDHASILYAYEAVNAINAQTLSVEYSTVGNSLVNGIYADNIQNVTIENCSVYSNYNGILVDMPSGRTASIKDNTIYSNSVSGIAIPLSSGNVDIIGNTIYGNTETGIYNWAKQSNINFNTIVEAGTGIWVYTSTVGGAFAKINSNIITIKGTSGSYKGIHVASPGSYPDPVIKYNDVWSNYGTEYSGNISDQTGSNGNISSDPKFVNAATNNYALQATSPVIDMGDPTATRDDDGTWADMGALYYDQPPLTVEIEGPSSLQSKTWGNYEASVTGSSGAPTTYQWYKKTTGSYSYVGSGTTYNLYMPAIFDVTLKVIASRGGLTDEDTQFVNNGYSPLKSLSSLPVEFALSQNYPNPFNPSTEINFALPKQCNVSLRIYDLSGAEVRAWDMANSFGYQSVRWDGTNSAGKPAAAGMYLYRLVATPTEGSAPFVETRKMLLLK